MAVFHSKVPLFQKICRRHGVLFLVCGILAIILIATIIKRNKTSVCDNVYRALNGNDKSRYFDMFYEKFGSHTKNVINLDLYWGRGRLDNQQIIRIYDFVRVGNAWEAILKQYDVCFATETSIERLYRIPKLLATWSGPVSIAVHLVTGEEWLVFNLYSLFLERCIPSYRDRVVIHLAIPITTREGFYYSEESLREWNVGYLTIEAMKRDCDDTWNFLIVLLQNFNIPNEFDKDKIAMKVVYPYNHLRNIARKGCPTQFTYSSEIELVPREGMAEMIQEFFKSLSATNMICPLCAYVIPTFELIQTKCKFPMNKAEMVKCYNKGNAIQYQGNDRPLAHEPTNYQLWTTTNLEESPVKVSHEVKLTDDESISNYEPFYISPDSIPPFNERLMGYGQTRSSQFLEAYSLGWNFTVLTPVFAVRWIFPPSDEDETSTDQHNMTIEELIKYNQSEINRGILNNIRKAMLLKRQKGH